MTEKLTLRGNFRRSYSSLRDFEFNFYTSFHPKVMDKLRGSTLSWSYTWCLCECQPEGLAQVAWCCPILLQFAKERVCDSKFGRDCHGQTTIDIELLPIGYKGLGSLAYKFDKERSDQVRVTWAYLKKASKKMKKWADKKRLPRKFQVGGLLLVKICAHTKLGGWHRGFIQRYEGPFPVLKKVEVQAYKVK